MNTPEVIYERGEAVSIRGLFFNRHGYLVRIDGVEWRDMLAVGSARARRWFGWQKPRFYP